MGNDGGTMGEHDHGRKVFSFNDSHLLMTKQLPDQERGREKKEREEKKKKKRVLIKNLKRIEERALK